MYRDLLVAVTRRGDDAAAVSAACALVRDTDGHVTVLVQDRIVALPDPGMGLLPSSVKIDILEQVRRETEAACAHWRETLRHEQIAGDVRSSADGLFHPARTAATHARYADATLVGLGDPGPVPAEIHDEIAALLDGSGRPVLVIPPGTNRVGRARILVAWRPCASAARAVHEALPMLARAASVDVVCVDTVRRSNEHGDDPGADIARHLMRHGIDVTVHSDTDGVEEPGEALLRNARTLASDLMVMGAYGRSRFREWIFGSTTRHVLGNATLPVLLSQ